MTTVKQFWSHAIPTKRRSVWYGVRGGLQHGTACGALVAAEPLPASDAICYVGNVPADYNSERVKDVWERYKEQHDWGHLYPLTCTNYWTSNLTPRESWGYECDEDASASEVEFLFAGWGQMPAEALVGSMEPEEQRDEVILAEFLEGRSTATLARMLQEGSRPTQRVDTPIGFDPDDYPLF